MTPLILHFAQIPYRLDKTELVLFLILTFGGSNIRNSWSSPQAAATRIIRELVLFKSSYIPESHQNQSTDKSAN